MRSFIIAAASLYASLTSAQGNGTAQYATAFALTYGYPLLAFQKLATPFISGNITNFLYHMPKLATAADRAVVKPNVDTLYSVVIYDLSQTDLSLTIPDSIRASQFALFSFYDPYGDNYANAGTGNFNQTQGQNVANGTVAIVHSPTTYGIILIRWLIKSGNEDDVRAYQNATRLQSVQRSQKGDIPTLTSLSILNTTATTPAETVLRLLAKLTPWNQPQLLGQTEKVNATLQAADATAGGYSKPVELNIVAANSSGGQDVLRAAGAQENNVRLNNGRSITRPGLAGNFDNGTNYAYRAAIASAGYLVLQAPNAVYPSWSNLSATNTSDALGSDQFYLGPDEAYMYTFSPKPPLMSTGFCSITAYADNYLIPNDLNRYQLGDRSNLTFLDGSLLYGPNAKDTDGSFQVLVQPADRAPPGNWTSNWLPGPAGGGNMTALLRWYEAEDDLLDGTYMYPVVTRRPAILASDPGNGTATVPGSPGSPTMQTGSNTGGSSPSPSTSAAFSYHSTYRQAIWLLFLWSVMVFIDSHA